MSTTTIKSTGALLDRAYGYILSSKSNRSWRYVFAGVGPDETGEEAIRRRAMEIDKYNHEYTYQGTMKAPYPWEGDWGRFDLEVQENGTLKMTCGDKLRANDNVPFLKDLSRAERHDLMRVYHDMTWEEQLEYLKADLNWYDLQNYSGGRTDHLWFDLLRPAVQNSELELVRPEDVGALTGNHTLMSDEIDRTDDGDVVSCGRVYYFNSYHVQDPIMELITQGEIILNVT
jgi:hypothetical protein